MTTFTRFSFITLVAFATLTGCGGGGGGGGGGVTTPPVADQSPSGIWDGQGVTTANPDVTTSFEFKLNGPFTVGTAPFTATFPSGRAETRGNTAFYVDGNNAWHVLVGTPATVTFGTLPKTLSFWVRTESGAVASTINILDENAALIRSVTPTTCRVAPSAPMNFPTMSGSEPNTSRHIELAITMGPASSPRSKPRPSSIRGLKTSKNCSVTP